MRGIRKLEIVEVVKTTTVIGEGTEKDPVRDIIQYWDKTGEKIAEHDAYVEDIQLQRRKASKAKGDHEESSALASS